MAGAITLPRIALVSDTSLQKDDSLLRGTETMGFFSALMPRETRFFALFNRHAEYVVQGGRPLPTSCTSSATNAGGRT